MTIRTAVIAFGRFTARAWACAESRLGATGRASD
jgi:hypothetical protein